MALALCLTLLPTAALAEDGHQNHCVCGNKNCSAHGSDITDWQGVNALTAEMTAGHYYLTNDVTLTGTWSPKDDVVLCLNGHSIEANGGFDAITVNSGITFTLTDCKGTGSITHTGGGKGRGVKVSGGTFNMYGGEITGNNMASNSEMPKESPYGGGVYIGGVGTFNLYDGKITQNTATNGGGVDIGLGKFNMYGGDITNNTASKGGGVYVANSSTVNTFNMYGGTISGNTAQDDENKQDDGAGGGVYIVKGSTSFTMTGGTIGGTNDGDANKATYGGGVYVGGANSKFTMSGGEITGNTAKKGGGVGVYSGATFEMNGGASVSGNTMTGNGGGVYMGGGKFTVSGAARVTGNTNKNKIANNVYLPDNRSITISGALTGEIGVTTESKPKDSKSIDIATGVTAGYSGKFSSDDSTYVVKREDNKLVLATTTPTTPTGHTHYLCGKTHKEVGDHKIDTQITFTKWEGEDSLPDSTGNWYLTKDVTLSSTWTPVSGTVLCLNGYSITGPASSISSEGYVIAVKDSATFTLCDCKGGTNTDGKITHAENTKGGGVYVGSSSTFNMYGGEISGNTAKMGGGVYVNNGTFKLYGGSITGNTAQVQGGGVYVDSSSTSSDTFNMYSGSITGNNASNGGGVYVNSGTFNLYGGSITGNTAEKGGGVRVYGGTFTVSGNVTVTGNQVVGGNNPVENNVSLCDEKTITIGAGALSGKIGVTTDYRPTGGGSIPIANGAKESDKNIFKSDRADYEVIFKDNQLVLVVEGTTGGGTTPSVHEHTYGDWSKNATNHWHECTDSNCTNKTGSVKDEAVHVYTDDADTTCNICGYVRTVTPSNPGGSTGGSTGGTTGGGSSGGGSSSGGSSGGSSSGGSSSDRDSSDSNPVIKTETKNNADGSTTKTETRRDGSVTQTTTGKDGSVTKTETKRDGSSVTENKAADGSTGTVKTDKNGQTEAAAKVSGKAVEDMKKNGEAVKVPVEVEATRNSSTAPTVSIELPKGAGETKVEIPVSNVTPGTVAVLVHPDGTEKILKDSIPTEDGIQLTVDGSATVKIVDNSKGFIDTRNHWAEDEIDFVSARGLVNGMSATIYAPNASTTRAQLWTILARQNDANLNGGNTWYEKAQNWAKDKGVSDGANPNAAINRAQMVTMLWRAVDQPTAGSAANFTDVPANSYYAQAVAWAVENSITTGIGNGLFGADKICTRAQIAAFLARSMK